MGGQALGSHDYGVVVVANNCGDNTAVRARQLLAARAVLHRVVETHLPPVHSNAGFARGLALDIASLWLERGVRNGILLSTDADTQVGGDWVARNHRALRASCSAVAGRFALDPAERMLLPSRLRERLVLEEIYEQALLALAALLDPVPHDPWPNHWTASGASYGLLLSAYRQIGGLPCCKVGEDRALTAALRRHDLPIRHDPDILVTTSARLLGRARNGCAATLRRRSRDVDLLCDEKLEALPAALRRMVWRRRLREAHRCGKTAIAAWSQRLRVRAEFLEDAAHQGFGEMWARLESASPRLAPVPLPPIQLPAHILAAQRLLAILTARSVRHQQIEPIVPGSPLEREVGSITQRGNKEFRGLVAGQGVISGARPMHEFDMAIILDATGDTVR